MGVVVGVFLGVAVGGGKIIGDAMIPFSSSRFQIPVLEIPVCEINI
jgi:hypothetical protein